MHSADIEMIEKLEQAIDDRDGRRMRELITEWDGGFTMSAKQYRETFNGARRREWIDYLAEECGSLIRAIRASDADEYWAIRSRV
jgi:hypothetical protein